MWGFFAIARPKHPAEVAGIRSFRKGELHLYCRTCGKAFPDEVSRNRHHHWCVVNTVRLLVRLDELFECQNAVDTVA
mgnify:CR=1 FL=1